MQNQNKKTTTIQTVYGTNKYSKLVRSTKTMTNDDWKNHESFFEMNSVQWILDNWENALWREFRQKPNHGDLVTIVYSIENKRVQFEEITFHPLVIKKIDKSVGNEVITFTKEYSDEEFWKCKKNPNYEKVWTVNNEIVIKARRSVCDYYYETNTKKNHDGESIYDSSYYDKTEIRQINDGYVTRRSNAWLTINGLI